jgi:hypothetical protein
VETRGRFSLISLRNADSLRIAAMTDAMATVAPRSGISALEALRQP